MHQKETEHKASSKNPRADQYAILREHRRTDDTFKSIDELEIEYVELTDKLIHKMTHGETFYHKGEQVHEAPTKVVFLDKSARPLAWLTKDLWDTLAPNPGSDEIPARPDFKFLNIDRLQWKDMLDPNDTGAPDVGLVPDEILIGLRSLYNKDHDGSFDAPNEMDDQVIMVVDEVRSTGKTLNIATGILERAFPNSKVFGTHWMGGVGVKPGATGNADVPVWYRDDRTNSKFTTGRGIGNRRPESAIQHPSEYFLSTRLPDVDQRALRLRDDFKILSAAVKAREVPYIPSRNREDDAERSEFVNGLPLAAVYAARRAIRAEDKDK